jgi:two-component system, LytTR family, sensor kinase
MPIRLLIVLFHLLLWVGLYGLFSPVPEPDLGIFELPPLNPQEVAFFLGYGYLINAALIYTYAHLALPKYQRQPQLSYFVLLNGLYLTGAVVLESGLDYLYMQAVHQRGGYGDPAGSFFSWFKPNLVMSTLIMLVANFYGFTYAWFRDQRVRVKLEQEKLRSELLALKHQINPHFLFNVLNSLYGLALNHNDEPTAEGIAKLSQMMRYMLYESNGSFVDLDREIDYIENYISLQKLRTHPNTHIHFTVSGSTHGRQIAPMLFIPFIENAFKHGISTVQTSEIHIRLVVREKDLVFETENTWHELKPSEGQPGGIGLQNVQQRLDLLYTGAHRLHREVKDGRYHTQLILDL